MSLSDWRASRALTSARAGKISGGFARTRLERYARNNLLAILLTVGLIGVLAIVAWLFIPASPSLRGAVAGMVVGVGLMSIYFWLVLESGASSGMMGEAAERWTDAELQRLRRRGWRHVNHLVIRNGQGDIDHVAVGPDGVLVIETKWRSAEVDVDDLDRWWEGAIRTTKENRESVRKLLQWWNRKQKPIQGVLVIWGPDVSHRQAEAGLVDDINIVAGHRLAEELGYLGDERLTKEEIDDAYAKLVDQLHRADGWERRDADPASPSLRDWARTWALRVAGAWCGLVGALSLMRLPGYWWLPAIGSVGLAGLVATRVPAVRSAATGLLGGVLAAAVLALVVVGVTA